MLTIRRSGDRGHAEQGWLTSDHSFSFAHYYDSQHMGFRSLRVINEDIIAPGKGFPMHSHQDMEIITYIVSGALAHKDSLGNTEVIGAHGVQRFSAGTGVTHSEFNPSPTDPVHLLQIWILPDTSGLTPSYEQMSFPVESQRQQWRRLAGRAESAESVKIHQDAAIYITALEPGETCPYALPAQRHAWLQVIQGDVTLNGTLLHAGDAAAVQAESVLDLKAETAATVMLFDLA
jgi:quercetin 2,3-dioxygenase